MHISIAITSGPKPAPEILNLSIADEAERQIIRHEERMKKMKTSFGVEKNVCRHGRLSLTGMCSYHWPWLIVGWRAFRPIGRTSDK